MESEVLDKIFADLEFLKAKVIEIEGHIVDVDSLLTEEEKQLIDESIEEQKQGKLIPFAEVKKQLSIE